MIDHEIHGYAIVSDNDRIADEHGTTPDALRNHADMAYFQAELDRADLTVLGRLGHEANPNRRLRPRLILSSQSAGLELASDGWWWNPALMPWAAAVQCLVPNGGRVAVPGGLRVFDHFLKIGYSAFHLSRAQGVNVPGGIPVFSECHLGRSSEEVLQRRGMRPAERRILDPVTPVILTIWSSASNAKEASLSPESSS